MNIKSTIAWQLLFLLTVFTCSAQSEHSITQLNKNLDLIDSAFERGDTERFNKVFPLEKVQNFYKTLIDKKFTRKVGAHKIVRIYPDSAYVLLSGTALYGNSGDETSFSTNYSGIYKFQHINGLWTVRDRISIDRMNKIKKQNLNLEVEPGKGIKVSDTLLLDVNDQLGFSVKLNHRAFLSNVSVDGHKAAYSFNGGVLWVDMKLNKGQRLIIDYTLAVESDDRDRNSAYFGDAFGHLRNQYFWHPFFSFSSANDRADFTVHCTIPKGYGLSTSLPQKQRVIGDLNVIEAKSFGPTFALAIYYDRNWEVKTFKKDKIELVVYASKDFEPTAEKLYESFSKTYDTLEKHLGKPLGDFFGIVQDRSNGGNGWKNRSNSTVIAAEKGSYLITDQPSPRAVFGHEIAHQWTNPHGESTNFLTEGWATYAESILLQSLYGDTIITKFFSSQKQNYMNGNFNGRYSLSEDYGNSGVSYSKGAWLFYMLEHQIGKKGLSRAMAKFTTSADQSINSFIGCINSIAGKNMAPFINSWLTSKVIPEISLKRSGNTLTITQESAIFIFPLTIRFNLANGRTIDKMININSHEQAINLNDIDPIGYTVDPENRVLMVVK